MRTPFLVAFLPLVAIPLACTPEKAEPPAAAPAVVDAGAAAPVDAGSVAAAPELPEPAGISAGAQKPPEAPKGKGTWAVDPANTSVSFTIVSNSAGLITGTFPNAAAGAFDAKKRSGVFTVDLTKMVTLGKDKSPNPVRDTNVIESFFAARPFALEANKAKVDEVWKQLDGKIQSGVGTAALVVDSVEGGDAKKGASAEGTVNGKLVLWDSVAVPVSFPVTVTNKGKTLEIAGTGPVKFDIEQATGSKLRKLLFDAMIAAGCAHQPGIQNEVTVTFDKVTLKQK